MFPSAVGPPFLWSQSPALRIRDSPGDFASHIGHRSISMNGRGDQLLTSIAAANCHNVTLIRRIQFQLTTSAIAEAPAALNASENNTANNRAIFMRVTPEGRVWSTSCRTEIRSSSEAFTCRKGIPAILNGWYISADYFLARRSQASNG
jgi:hypothetical protein